MNSTIYYFSSTGNSQNIAQIITRKLNGNLYPMVGNMNSECSSEVIGIVFPTYFWGIPHIVKQFLSSLQINTSNPYIFAVTTCGMTSGGALGMVKEILQKRKLTLNYGKAIRSVSNYIVEYNIHQKSISSRLKAAKFEAEQVAETILEQKSNNIHLPNLFDKLFYKIYLKRCSQDNRFSVSSSCNQCGICEKICPANNIVLMGGIPQFKHHCEHCIACVHWCPQQAIQFKDKTTKHVRYHNPEIKVTELNK